MPYTKGLYALSCPLFLVPGEVSANQDAGKDMDDNNQVAGKDMTVETRRSLSLP